jgi:UTP:GlnB (protein PII) uridylyltransferase
MDLALGLRISDLGEHSEASIAIGIAQQALNRAIIFIDANFRHNKDLNFALKARAEIIDEFLNLAWNWADLKFGLKATLGPSVLIGLGAYGRQALYSSSPIEVLLLVERPLTKTCSTLDHFLDFCWQSGLSLVHHIHMVTNCTEIFRDLNTFSLCLDPRFIIGEPSLFETFLKVQQAQKFWSLEAFIVAQLEQLSPHKNLPNILAALQLLTWIALLCSGIRDRNYFLATGILNLDEATDLDEAELFLGKISYFSTTQIHERKLQETQKLLDLIFTRLKPRLNSLINNVSY